MSSSSLLSSTFCSTCKGAKPIFSLISSGVITLRTACSLKYLCTGSIFCILTGSPLTPLKLRILFTNSLNIFCSGSICKFWYNCEATKISSALFPKPVSSLIPNSWGLVIPWAVNISFLIWLFRFINLSSWPFTGIGIIWGWSEAWSVNDSKGFPALSAPVA